MADVAGNLVNFFLVPLYTAYLSPAEYGTLALLLLFGTVAKIAFRLQLDSGFFRIHYELDDPRERRRLAGTVLAFSALFGAVLFGVLLVVLAPLTSALLGTSEAASRRLVLLAAADVWAGSFAFVPLLLLRIEDRPGLFSTFTATRQLVNTLLKVAFVVQGYGLEGVLWSDVISTALMSLALLPVLRGRVEPAFSWMLLRPVLGFALPKVPHGVMVQALALADRRILDAFVTRAEVGLYQVAYTFGSGVKFALSAFEPAWQPFVYAEAKNRNAPHTLARVTTPVFAGFVAAGTGMAVLGPELLALMTPANPEYRSAGPVVPVVAAAYVLHGLFLLTSVGIGIARRTGWYPAVTAVAVAVNLAANLLLVPRHGIMGAAWATVISYAVMAGFGAWASHRSYPVPFAWRRLVLLLGSGVAVTLVSRLAPTALVAAIPVKLVLLAAYAALLLLALRRDRRI